MLQIEDVHRFLTEKGSALSDAAIGALRWKALAEMNHRSMSGNAALALAFLFVTMSSNFAQTHPTLFYSLFSLTALTISARIIVMVLVKWGAGVLWGAREKQFYISIVSFATTWGVLTAAMLVLYDTSWEAMIVVLFSAGMGAGALANFCIWRSLVVVYITVLFIPSIAVSIAMGNSEGYILAAGLAIFMAYLLVQVRFWNREYWSSRINNELLAIRAVELQKEREISEAANRAKSDFLSSMSHELRTPLNAILGFTQLLQFDPASPLTPTQKDNTDHVIKGGQHLLELIDQVLELAKIEAGKVSINIEPVPIREVLVECFDLVRLMGTKLNLTISTNGDECPDVDVLADRTRLKQALLNLLSNAVKYNCENGTVSISTRVNDGSKVHIAVFNTGDGIPMGKQSSIFEPFNRLGHESSEIDGTGIGLVITRELLYLMDGTIGFESEEGKGATFWIEVPLVQQNTENNISILSEDNSTPAETTVDAKGHQYLALYVEDNPANVILVEKIMGKESGFSIITAHTAELGLEMAEAYKPDVILMDINLAGMSGIEATQRLKHNDKTKNIPVIAITAAAMAHEVENGKNADFHAYLTKPIDVQSFLTTVREALGLK